MESRIAMRTSKVITLLIALLLSGTALTGCLGGSDDAEETPDGSDGTDTGAGDGTGTGDGTDPGDGGADTGDNSTGTGDAGAGAQKPNDVNETLTLSVGAGVNAEGSPAAARGEVGFTVPGEDWATFSVTITPQEVHADRVTVTVYDAEGASQGEASFSFSAEPGEPQEITVTTGAIGDWTIVGQANTMGQSAQFDVLVSITY